MQWGMAKCYKHKGFLPSIPVNLSVCRVLIVFLAHGAGLKVNRHAPSIILNGGDKMKTHGLSCTKLYHCWASMKSRCNNPNSQYYSYYGMRGIKVCEEWYDFKTFYDWAMCNGYSEGLTIDRIDNDKGYNPGNCRWITMREQNKNKRIYRSTKEFGAGVNKLPSGNYRARVKVDNKYIHIGVYSTAYKAKEAREEFIRRNNLDPL